MFALSKLWFPMRSPAMGFPLLDVMSDLLATRLDPIRELEFRNKFHIETRVWLGLIVPSCFHFMNEGVRNMYRSKNPKL